MIVGVPVLRLQGDYLAIVTLAFGEIIRNVLNCVYVSNDAGQLYFGFNNPSSARQADREWPSGCARDLTKHFDVYHGLLRSSCSP